MHPSGIIKVQKWNLLKAAPETAFVMYNEMLLWTPLNSTKKKKNWNIAWSLLGKKLLQTERMVWNIFINTVMWSPNRKKATLQIFTSFKESAARKEKQFYTVYGIYIFIWLFADQFLSLNSNEAAYLLTFFHHMKWNINKFHDSDVCFHCHAQLFHASSLCTAIYEQVKGINFKNQG